MEALDKKEVLKKINDYVYQKAELFVYLCKYYKNRSTAFSERYVPFVNEEGAILENSGNANDFLLQIEPNWELYRQFRTIWLELDPQIKRATKFLRLCNRGSIVKNRKHILDYLFACYSDEKQKWLDLNLANWIYTYFLYNNTEQSLYFDTTVLQARQRLDYFGRLGCLRRKYKTSSSTVAIINEADKIMREIKEKYPDVYSELEDPKPDIFCANIHIMPFASEDDVHAYIHDNWDLLQASMKEKRTIEPRIQMSSFRLFIVRYMLEFDNLFTDYEIASTVNELFGRQPLVEQIGKSVLTEKTIKLRRSELHKQLQNDWFNEFELQFNKLKDEHPDFFHDLICGRNKLDLIFSEEKHTFSFR